MPSITLADIQSAADKKYGPLVISDVPGGPVELVNPLRMDKAKRDRLTKLDAIEDPEEKLAEAIRIGVAKASDAKRLLAAVTDLAALAEIVNAWTSSAQVGEASPSPS
jgi:hypothetical protein